MKKNVLITGANGNIAKELTALLKDKYQIRYLTRKKSKDSEFTWNIEKQEIDESALQDIHHIIHLAGANIGEKKWTEERKKVILSSRIDSAKLLLNTLKKRQQSIESLISASAIGYYGSVTSDKIFSETDKKGSDFLSDVCFQWESIADEFKIQNITQRIIKIRTGVVLSNDKNGVLGKMKTPIQNYTGACLGSGKQYIPWIHEKDLCSIYKYALENIDLHGAYNAVAPEFITNKDLTYALAKALQKPIWLPNIPSFVLHLMFGEMASLLLEGSRIFSNKIENSGYSFQFKKLNNALKSLLE